MGTTGRVVGTVVLLVFVSLIALRPLLSNPAITATLTDGPTSWQTALFLPLLLLAIVIAILRVRTVVADESDTYSPTAEARTESSGWSTDSESERTSPADYWDGSQPEEESEDRVTATDSGTAGDSNRPNILAGQGGTRNKDFEIEDEPPESGLDLHLEHLRAELGDDESLAADLDALEAVATEEATERVPARCPQEYCNALWSEPGILGIGSGKYDVLDDGRQVVCLECEQIHTLD